MHDGGRCRGLSRDTGRRGWLVYADLACGGRDAIGASSSDSSDTSARCNTVRLTMLRKLGSPRKGSRFAAATAPPQDKNDDQDMRSLAGGSASIQGGIQADATSPPTSPTKKRLSMWTKKTPTKAPEVPSLNLPTMNETLPSNGEDDPSIVQQPREDEIKAEPPTADGKPSKPSPLVRTPRQRAILEEAEAKPVPATTKADEKKSRRSKRDSLGLKSLMTKREKANVQEEKPEQSTPDSPVKKTEDDARTDNNRDAGRSPTKKKTPEVDPPPLSPMRRKPRATTVGLGSQRSTIEPIQEATSLLGRKSITRVEGAPPMQQPEVHLIGEIVGGDGFGNASDGYCCKWSVDYGNQWIHIAGDQIGQTQIDYSAPLVAGEGGVVWAHPIDLHFATTALHGWPKLLLQVWRVDGNMKMNVVGYGFVHLPFAPGHHQLTVSMWRPMGSSKEELGAALLGHTPELLTDEVLFNTAWSDRCRLKTIATGRVHVSVGVVVRNFDCGLEM